MSEIIIPVGVRIAKFAELSPRAQELLLKIIDHRYAATQPGCTREQFRESLIDMLETGEVCVEEVPGGLQLKLVNPQSGFLM